MCCGDKYDAEEKKAMDAPITGGLWYCRTIGGVLVCLFSAILGTIVVIMLESEFWDILIETDDGCK